MAEILTQEEIDALLQALSSGEIVAEAVQKDDERKVKAYDFRRPDKFSKEQIRTLNMIHENFARGISTMLSARLRAMVDARVASVEQMTYAEFTRSMPNPTNLSIFNLPPLEGSGALELNPNLTFSIIDRLLGGTGTAGIKNRPLTDIEQSIIEKIILASLDALKESWENVIAFEPELEKVETNPMFAQLVPPNDMVILITMVTKIGEVEGMINVCIPYMVLEPVINKLTAQFWFSSVGKTVTSKNADVLQKRLEKANIPLVVELGHTKISVRELLELQVRDVIKLDTGVNDELNVMVGSDTKFKGRPGLFGSRISVQITSVLPGLKVGGEEDE